MLFQSETVMAEVLETIHAEAAGTIGADAAAERLFSLDPESVTGYVLLAEGLSKVGDLEGAESAWWRALEKAPGRAMMYFSLADLVRNRDTNPSRELASGLMDLGIWKLAFG